MSILIDLLTSDIVRYLVAAELLLLLGASVFVHGVHHDDTPKPQRSNGRGLQSVALVVAVAILVNALSPLPLTPGAYVVAVGALPATVNALRLAWVAAAHGIRAHREFVALAAGVDDLAPCETPDCVAARARLRALNKP